MKLPVSIAQGVLAWLLLLHHSAKPNDTAKQSPGAESSGSISGIIKFKGEIPKSPVSDDAGLRRDLVEVDRATRGLRDVVVSLVPLGSLGADIRKPRPGRHPAQMDQREYSFVPRVLAVSQGEAVVFTNSDPANHNVPTASSAKSNEFNIYVSKGNKHEHRFVAQDRPIRVGCDIHPWMLGWIYVFDHPHFAVSDQRGEFRIGPVHPGNYTLLIEQPDIRSKKEQKINVMPGQAATVQIELLAGLAFQPQE